MVILATARNRPDFHCKLTPTAALLFRFSALTFNAHAIHLDRAYCREVEGHRNILVHGPLSLVLMLKLLQSQVHRFCKGAYIKNFDYKNLAPIYADEEMKICGRFDPVDRSKVEIWIEGRDGGYAVRGRAILGRYEGWRMRTNRIVG